MWLSVVPAKEEEEEEEEEEEACMWLPACGQRAQISTHDCTCTCDCRSRFSPIEVKALGSDNVEICAGHYHSLVRKMDESVYGFGCASQPMTSIILFVLT
jgi:hypothetical protein